MSIIDIGLAVVFFVNATIATLILVHRGEGKDSVLCSILAYSAGSWTLSMFLFNTFDLSHIIIPTKMLYVSGILMATSFLIFGYTFLENLFYKVRKRFWLIVFFSLTAILLIIFTDHIVDTTVLVNGERIIQLESYYLFYCFLIAAYFFWGYKVIFQKIKNIRSDYTKSRQFIYVVIGTSIPFTIGMIFNIILPFFGEFTYYWMGPLVTFVFVSTISYSIINYSLFDVKIILVELLTILVWIFICVRVVMSSTLSDFIQNGVLFLATLVVGILLMRSAGKEVKQRERAEELAEDLKCANEQLRELNEREKEFLSFASHQLKSPLTSIKGYASLIMEESFGKVSDSIYDVVSKMFVSANSMNRSVNDFLNISRIEQGRLKYDTSVFDLADLAREVVVELKPSASKKSIPLKVLINDDENYIVEADNVKMEQVITNLIDNAIKYTQEGEIEVSVSRVKGEDGKDKIRIAVSDSGIGMEQETIDALFKKYKRAKNAEQKKIEGTGLGLYIAKKMVEGMGGRVWAESGGEDKGSTFYAELLAV